MSSGSYMPPAVLRVEIPKTDGGTRELGIPTIADRVAQMVVKDYLEPILEKHFHNDSYGYRPVIRGWVNYYSLFAKYKLLDVMRYFDRRLEKWAKRKFKSLKRRQGKANKLMTKIAKSKPTLFPHWKLKYQVIKQ